MHILRLSVDATSLRIRQVAHDSELCSQYDSATLAFDRFADKFFILVGAVNVGRIEKIHSQFERAMNGRDRLVVVKPAVEFRHAHAAEAKRRDLQAATAKFACFHEKPPR